MPTSIHESVIRNLADAAVAGPWELPAVTRRLGLAIQGRARWTVGLARRVFAAFPVPPDPRRLRPFIEADAGFQRAAAPHRNIEIGRWFWVTPSMHPVRDWGVPALRTTVEVADWLGITVGQLDWFADVQGRNPRQTEPRLQHYTQQWVPKRGGRYRLLEIPRPRLKAIQRRVLHDILDRIPPHDAAHGFRSGRSIRTFAAPHAGRAAVWRIDLKDFFPSIPASRVHALFGAAGYPETVARVLTGLCTTMLPVGVRSPDGVTTLYRQRHLPQGAPTSSAIANLGAYRLDIRLAAWAAKCGAMYTRYADDLAFSGGTDFAHSGHRFRRIVLQIIVEEGFRPNGAKSRWMTPGGRQQLTGVVVNQHPNIKRAEFDLLKAILTNCIRFGPAEQNREGRADFRAHLLGRIAHVGFVNPTRGQKLRAQAQRIVWE
jgi:RNA-directed DNA polymerase